MTIKSGFTKFATITGLVLSMLTVPALATAADNVQSHDHGVTELRLNDGAKWEIDEPLSQAMNNIRDAVAQDIDAIRANELEGQDYIALSEIVNSEIAYMIENCELEPEADAQLHLIIHDMIDGATAMSEQNNARDGAMTVADSLDDYAT